MAMFARLNTTHLHNDEGGKLNRGSFYFRRERWAVQEMSAIMVDIADRAVMYYFSKYREVHFAKRAT